MGLYSECKWIEKCGETYSHCSAVAMALLGHRSRWETAESLRQQDFGEFGHETLVNTVLDNVGGFWDHFMERYVEQCPIVLILQTKYPFERTGKNGIINCSFLDCWSVVNRQRERDLEKLVITNARAWNLQWLGTVTNGPLVPAGGMPCWSRSDLYVLFWSKDARRRVQANSTDEDNTEDPVVWSISRKTRRENENFACPPLTHWDFRIYLKEKGDNMRRWEEKPFINLALWAQETGESLWQWASQEMRDTIGTLESELQRSRK